MALGIKKITESVVEDGRSLILIGSEYRSGIDRIDFTDNRAVPVGAILAVNQSTSIDSGTLRIKSGENAQMRINAHTTLAPKTVTRDEIGNAAVLNEHLNDRNAPDATRSVANHNIRNNEVISSKIPSAAILNRHLNDPEAKDADRTVANYNIRNNAVTSDKILKDAVTTVKIADNAIVTSKIANNRLPDTIPLWILA